MKSGKRRLVALAMLFLMIVTVPASLFAAEDMSTAEDNGIKVTLTTDKESYEPGEKVKVNYKIENAGQVNVTKAQIQYAFPTTMIKEDEKAFKTMATAITADKPFEVTGVLTGDEATYGSPSVLSQINIPMIAGIVVGILLVVVVAVIVGKKKKNKNVPPAAAAIFVVIASGLVLGSMSAQAVTASKTTMVVKKQITYAEQAVTLQIKADIMTMPVLKAVPNDKKVPLQRVTVHDPSVVKDVKSGDFYIFGSHRDWAKSSDLMNWVKVTNNINTGYTGLFNTLWTEYCKTATNPDMGGNLWAPDVYYNKTMGKYCMYMSLNGDDWNSILVLLTADDISGPYEYVGPVIYSGFNTDTHDVKKTDVYKVLGENADITRYQSTSNTKLNAIDPCVVEDEQGNVYVVFGSWFGGIYMFDIDEATGLRDYNVKYETVANVSDAYYGYKIAGGNGVSGEGPFIDKFGDYYYLFMSYGGLASDGGYNMRVFRSEKVTGPYVDIAGKPAIYTSGGDNINGSVGYKIMGNYQWSTMTKGEVAQGHNSIIEDNGKYFLIYHTRFDNMGEGHEVRVHQMFINEEGWLVCAPYDYQGETISQTGYSKEEVVGEYEFILHKHDISYGTREVAGFEYINLNDDGSVTGDYEGTWTMTDGTPYVTLTIDGQEYKGNFCKMNVNESSIETMTFTAAGNNNVAVWGSKLYE